MNPWTGNGLRCIPFRALGVLVGLVLVSMAAASPASAASRTYTLDADFDEGNLINVNHDAPNNDQLQLNSTTTPFPFIWIANSNRGTICRVDVNTGTVLGEYRSAPQGRDLNPSRTTVDLFGNVWSGNRNEAGGTMGSAVKIGLVIGGTRGDKNPDGSFTPNPAGQYLAPPFQYNTCVDRDGDGYIKTSGGLGNILDWPDVTDGVGGADGIVQDADDECILIYQRINGPNSRHVSVDSNNDVWVAGYPFAPTFFNKLDGNTGAILSTFVPPCAGYGGLIDGNGVLWSAGIFENSLLRHDLGTNTSTCINVTTSYGLGIDTNGFIWNAMWTANAVMKIDSAGNIVPGFPKPTGGNSCRGVAVTPVDNHVWVANSGSASVSRLDNNGNILKIIPVGATPTGVAVDANGKVWVTNFGSDNAMRIDPNGGGDGLGAVDLTVGLGINAGPYNYSDMTGIVAIGSTAPQGTWTVVYDSGQLGTEWGLVSWNSAEPAGTGIAVKVRADDSSANLPSLSFVPVNNATAFTGLSGQFIEVQVVLSRDPGVTDTPILYDLTVSDCQTLDVVFGDSWDDEDLQDVLDAEYGVGVIDALTDYEGYLCGDADPPYWEDTETSTILVREIAGYRYKNIFGWYEETLAGAPTIDGVDDGIIFTGPMTEGATMMVTFPGGLTRFGFYLNPNGTDDAHNAPEPEMFFTNRGYNDIGPDGSGALHDPDDGDPQCLVYNITHLRDGVPTFVLAWEDLDYGAMITPTFDPNGTDNDFQDLVVEVSAYSPVPAVVASLQVQDSDEGVQLRWGIFNADRIDRLQITRSTGAEWAQVIHEWNGDSARAAGSWIDRDVRGGTGYEYQLIAELDGTQVYSRSVYIQRSRLDARTRLLASVPNPFNPSTEIRFRLAHSSEAGIRIYDPAGRLVRRIDLGVRPAGEGTVEWNGTDDRGKRVSSGSYLVNLVTPQARDRLRVTLIK